jgi:hypothetical protein
MDTKTHWEKVYEAKVPEAVSWYRPHLETSVALIKRAGVWHQLNAMGHSDPDRIGSGLRGLTHDDSQADRRWKRREGLMSSDTTDLKSSWPA